MRISFKVEKTRQINRFFLYKITNYTISQAIFVLDSHVIRNLLIAIKFVIKAEY